MLPNAAPPAAISCEHVESYADGVIRYRMASAAVCVEIINLGCAITRIDAPDREGAPANVVLGYPAIDGYVSGGEYFGVVVGRVANRIAHGRFRLGGRVVHLSRNHGPHHLHGGDVGFSRRLWRVRRASPGASATLEMELLSPEGEEGYPGNLCATVTYTLRQGGELEARYSATTDAPTIVNMTNHSYFNLRGEGRGDVLGHELAIAADRYCPVDGELIPTGELCAVTGTAFDFRRPVAIGQRIAEPDTQLEHARGYDHCMVLEAAPARSQGLQRACTLHDPGSGRRLSVHTDQPGLQLYTGNFLDGTVIGSHGTVYRRHAGVCLETQKYPDAPNHPDFPSVKLEPGERYEATTVLRFDVLP
jgi:aldose 1-epimerase